MVAFNWQGMTSVFCSDLMFRWNHCRVISHSSQLNCNPKEQDSEREENCCGVFIEPLSLCSIAKD